MAEGSYFFITGTGRSGTTLLQAMLSRGRGVFIPQETHFMSLVWKHRHRLGPLTSESGWTAAKDAIFRRSEHAGIAMDPDDFERLTASGPRNYGVLLSAWLHAAAKAQTPAQDPPPTILGEKSPVHASYVLELLAMLPEARVVHIVRDPRDVAVGMRDVWNTPPTSAAVRWLIDQRRQQDLESLVSPQRFVTVRYEDLVAQPEAQLRRVCDVLAIGFTPDVLEHHRRTQTGFAEHETHKRQTMQPVTTSRIGRYRRSLSPTAIAAIERVCGTQMERLGYEPEGYPRARGNLAVAAYAPSMVWRKLSQRVPATRIARQAAWTKTGNTAPSVQE